VSCLQIADFSECAPNLAPHTLSHFEALPPPPYGSSSRSASAAQRAQRSWAEPSPRSRSHSWPPASHTLSAPPCRHLRPVQANSKRCQRSHASSASSARLSTNTGWQHSASAVLTGWRDTSRTERPPAVGRFPGSRASPQFQRQSEPVRCSAPNRLDLTDGPSEPIQVPVAGTGFNVSRRWSSGSDRDVG
jgi:hypothetical protein